MKQLFFVLVFSIGTSVLAQSGVYVNKPNNSDGTIIKWTLTLNEDGTFLYHFLRDISAISKINTEENYYGKGTWILEGKSVILLSKDRDNLDGKYTKNLNNSKARYITKSTRDTSDKVVKTALRFYESVELKGLELFKE